MKISKSLLPVLGTKAVKVIPSDKRLVKQLHDNLFLSCFGSDLEWVNPKGHAIATKQRSDSIYVESRSNQLRLWIKNLRMEDVGDYTCRSASKEDEKFEVRNVMVRPEVDFKTDEQQMFIEGVDAEIACDFSANGLDTIVEWYAPGNPNPLLPNSGNNLLVEDITREDGGIYRCTVITTDTGDVDDVDILVEIEYPPEIDDFINVPADSEVWLTEGQNFSVPCEANALPAPEITWSRETAEGENDVIGKENNLMFTDIRLENSGKYICSAKNDHGTISKSFNLVVLSPPTTLVNDQLVDGTDFPYFVNLGDPMKFVCENMFPADFVWTTPDGSQAAMDQLNRIAETTDSGFYTCTSTIKRGRTNEMIEVSSSVNVQVRYQPMIATEELEIYSYPGLQTNIHCSFMANPVGFTAISGPEIEEELLLNEVNYAFKAEEKDFPSTFQCTSRNDLGSEEYEVSLLKAEKPKELRLLKLVQRRPDRVVISYSRDYSKGQIDLSDVVVHLSSPHRPDVIRTIPVDNQNHVTIDDLDPERTYILRLQGINAVGESPVSKKLEFTTDDLGIF
ncbi:unnamed protein product [Oikopleura dioica]|uniref:Uncharacterized protein n=1 Tax=Oikopleura dioica TaxID=34765 RepID=E4X1L3_OIKDI|nr:unnamed protein product [Oikopleura dioica]